MDSRFESPMIASDNPVAGEHSKKSKELATDSVEPVPAND